MIADIRISSILSPKKLPYVLACKLKNFGQIFYSVSWGQIIWGTGGHNIFLASWQAMQSL